MNILELIDRKEELFTQDIQNLNQELIERIESSEFLVIGGAGSIGQAVTKEIFKRNPKKLHVVDLSENNLVELVRDIRSSLGYMRGEFKTFAIDSNSIEFDALLKAEGKYDFVLNLSALKHVRSEKDPYTLMRMIDVNIFNTIKSIDQAIAAGAKKYFCVSTDKAANPVNMMGASKKIMEMFLMEKSKQIRISTARFANVAFSDGSLLHGFNLRIQKRQPIVAPNDIKRYFVVPKESGELCLLSSLLGENRDIFFPKENDTFKLISFADVAVKFLNEQGFEPYFCESEEEARELMTSLPSEKKWPCLFTGSNTTGEKSFEEFFTEKEELDLERFENIGIIKNQLQTDPEKLNFFSDEIKRLKRNGSWSKEELVSIFSAMLPDFKHLETGKYLDSKM